LEEVANSSNKLQNKTVHT